MRVLDSPTREDVRFGHVFLTSPVCRPANPDPADHSPLHFPEGHRAPELRAMRVVKTSRAAKRSIRKHMDAADRFIDLTERAVILSYLMNEGETFEDACLML